MPSERSKRRTIVLVTGQLCRELLLAFGNKPNTRYQIIGVVTEVESAEATIGVYPVLGCMASMAKLMTEHRPECVIVAGSDLSGSLFDHHLVEAKVCRNLIVDEAEAVYEELTGKVPIESLTATEMIFSGDYQISRSAQLAAQLYSMAVALIGIAALAPVLLLVSALIKLDSRGPVLFVQERVGQQGKRFRLYKFRTMHACEKSLSEWASDNRHRITRVGARLRKYRLDELPQLFNVLLGDMALVGPRPHPASNLRLFVLVSRNMPSCGVQIPYYTLRQRVRPGITGWAQVRYRYANDLDEEIEKLKFDLYYIKHYSLWLDLRIMLETMGVMLFKGDTGDSEPLPVEPVKTTSTLAAPKTSLESVSSNQP